MAIWIQNLVVLSLAAFCAWYLFKVARRAMNAKCGEAGSCCSSKRSQPKRETTPRVDFLPVEMLSRKK